MVVKKSSRDRILVVRSVQDGGVSEMGVKHVTLNTLICLFCL